MDPLTSIVDLQGVGSNATTYLYAEKAGDAIVYSLSNVLLPAKGALADALATGLGIPLEAPEGLPTEPVVAGAAANLASAAALAAGLLAAALLA